MLENLVTDRTPEDVTRWVALRNKGYENMTEEEKAEWNSGRMKGAYNTSDLNRVGAALNYLHERLTGIGYLPSNAFHAKEDWTAADVPTAADLTMYLNCVSAIREALTQPRTTPKAPENNGGLDYQEANNIEKILIVVDQQITNMLAVRYYSGDLYSGEI